MLDDWQFEKDFHERYLRVVQSINFTGPSLFFSDKRLFFERLVIFVKIIFDIFLYIVWEKGTRRYYMFYYFVL